MAAAFVFFNLLALLGVGVPGVSAGTLVKNCDLPTTGLTPLTDLGSGTYLENEGGLYPEGLNTVPASHLALGLELAADVTPRLPDGSIGPDGVIVFLSIGVSNTQLEFEAFTEAALADDEVNTELVFVNGAQIGRGLGLWASTRNDSTWERIAEELTKAQVTPQQVQVAWIMLPSRDRGPHTLEEARAEIQDFTQVVRDAKLKYPNLALAYISSRIYGGYIDDVDSEPNGYNHGFEMKWLIEGQIMGSAELNADPDKGPPVAPWLAWGPYLWADGTNPRSDGLIWVCGDFAPEGVHPAESGQIKVADMLMKHFKSDPTATSWFLESNGSNPPDSNQTTVTNPTGASTTVGSSEEASTTMAPPEDPASPALSFRWMWIAGGAIALGVGGAFVFRRVRKRPR